jgi:hypothetical protein
MEGLDERPIETRFPFDPIVQSDYLVSIEPGVFTKTSCFDSRNPNKIVVNPVVKYKHAVDTVVEDSVTDM